MQACELTGISRASLHRWQHPRLGPRQQSGGKNQPNAYSPAERQQIIDTFTTTELADKSVEQGYHILLGQGRYLGSISTIYRVLREANMVHDRRDRRTMPARVKPELVANGPDEVHCWDITKLATATRGKYLNAYVIEDIYSRKIIHAEVHERECAHLAAGFLDRAIEANGGVVPGYVHSDNGGPMVASSTKAFLASRDITASTSRPRVSNDNPFIESLFKTVKSSAAFPDRFESLEQAREFMACFVEYYNGSHFHSKVAYFPPGAVHDGSWREIAECRQRVLDEAFEAHPGRFRGGRPVQVEPPARAWINRPGTSIETG